MQGESGEKAMFSAMPYSCADLRRKWSKKQRFPLCPIKSFPKTMLSAMIIVVLRNVIENVSEEEELSKIAKKIPQTPFMIGQPLKLILQKIPFPIFLLVIMVVENKATRHAETIILPGH